MRLLPLGCFLCALCATTAGADVFRCQQDGRTVFTDRPCHASAEPMQLEPPTVLSAPGNFDDLAQAHDARLARERKAKAAADAAFLQQHGARKAEENRIRGALVEGRVVGGMSAEQVRQVWGSPDHIEPRVSGGKTQERWVYADQRQRRSVTFTDGVVTAASGSKR